MRDERIKIDKDFFSRSVITDYVAKKIASFTPQGSYSQNPIEDLSLQTNLTFAFTTKVCCFVENSTTHVQ